MKSIFNPTYIDIFYNTYYKLVYFVNDIPSSKVENRFLDSKMFHKRITINFNMEIVRQNDTTV